MLTSASSRHTSWKNHREKKKLSDRVNELRLLLPLRCKAKYLQYLQSGISVSVLVKGAWLQFRSDAAGEHI